MASKQHTAQAITESVIEAAKAVIMAVTETEKHIEKARTIWPTPRGNGLVLEQPTFDLKAPDKYLELNTFEIKFRNILIIVIWYKNSKRCQ